MAAYRRVYDSRHLQADCQEPGSAAEPCGNRVWAAFFIEIDDSKLYRLHPAARPAHHAAIHCVVSVRPTPANQPLTQALSVLQVARICVEFWATREASVGWGER